jgi:RNA polymerase sigma-70 factor (ECF subfamily)
MPWPTRARTTSNAQVGTRRSALMEAAQQGCRASYEELLRDCIPLISTIGLAHGITADGIDDLIQDVLVCVHRARNTFDPTRSFDAWLGAIARRRAIDAVRSKRRRAAREIHAPSVAAACVDPTRDPAELLELKSEAWQLRKAIEGLPPSQRAAVESLALKECSPAEAADLTGRSEGALKVNLHRAIRSLRSRLRHQY